MKRECENKALPESGLLLNMRRGKTHCETTADNSSVDFDLSHSYASYVKERSRKKQIGFNSTRLVVFFSEVNYQPKLMSLIGI